MVDFPMKLSVLLITYNHGKYIAQALESILRQEVNFDYEVVVGEDCSTDNTREIVLDYQSRYPKTIRAHLQQSNRGLIRNFVDTFHSCSGKYIATIDGDDFWTSTNKLQRQVDFLDSHEEYSICFHPVKMVFEGGEKAGRRYPESHLGTFCVEELLRSNFIPTCSVMLRNGVFGEFPDWYFSLDMEDWPLYVIYAQHGKIGFLDEIMGVYRIHDLGAWSSQDEISTCTQRIHFYQCMENHLPHRYRKTIKNMLDKYYFQLALLHETRKNMDSAKINLLHSLRIHPMHYHVGLVPKLKTATRFFFPAIYRFLKAQGA